MFLLKIDSNGSIKWTNQLGTNSPDKGYALSVDRLNNIIVVGSSKGNFEGNTNNGEEDIIIVKYNS